MHFAPSTAIKTQKLAPLVLVEIGAFSLLFPIFGYIFEGWNYEFFLKPPILAQNQNT